MKVLSLLLVGAVVAGGAYLCWPTDLSAESAVLQRENEASGAASESARPAAEGDASAIPTAPFVPAAEAEGAESGTGSVQGILTDPDGKTADGAKVRAWLKLPRRSGVPLEITTKKGGTFSFRNLAAGHWVIDAFDDAFALERPVTIEVAATGERILKLALDRGVAITGRAVDTAGQPRPEVRITLGAGNGLKDPRTPLEFRTDDAGLFSRAGLRKGTTWQVAAEHPDYYQKEKVSLALKADTRIEVPIQAYAGIEGRVVFADGRPVGNARVALDDLELGADTQGLFRFQKLRKDAGAVIVWAATPDLSAATRCDFQVEPGKTLSDVLVTVLPLATIKGRVVDTHHFGIGQAEVRATSRRSSKFVTHFMRSSDSPSSEVLSYSAQASDFNRLPAQTLEIDALHVAVERNLASLFVGSVQAQLALEEYETVETTTASFSSELAAGESPLGLVSFATKDGQIRLAMGDLHMPVTTKASGQGQGPPQPLLQLLRRGPAPARTDDDGLFTIAGVMAGTYRVGASKSKYFDGAERPTVTVTGPGEIAAADVVLALGGTLRISIERVAEAAAAPINVLAACPDEGLQQAQVTAEAASEVEFHGLKAGVFAVGAWSEDGLSARVENIEVALESERLVTLRLEPAGVLNGRLTLRGSPLAGQQMNLASLTFPAGDVAVETKDDGGFSFGNLIPGEYELKVNTAIASAPHSPERWFVRAGATTFVDFVLEEGGAVHGIICDEKGLPAKGINLFLRTPGNRIDAHSDAQGRFQFDSVPAGGHPLHARTDDMMSCVTTRVVVRDGERQELRLHLRPGLELRGRTEGDAKGERITIEAYGVGNDNLVRKGTADAGGNFVIRGLYEGDYDVRVAGRPNRITTVTIQHGTPTPEIVVPLSKP